jgi:hypothetical protein
VPGTAERDLASVELWQESLLRSQQRRVLAAEARKDVTRKKTASVAVSAAVAASPMWPSVTATAADLSKEEAGKLARKLEKKDGARVLLEYGDTDSAVAELQRALGISDDGVFGPHTRAAVKAFQAKHNLKPTGDVDVKTWLKLFPGDMVVYAPPGSKTALGVNNTGEPQWAAISTNPADHGKKGAAKLGRAAAVKAAKSGKGTTDPGAPAVRAASFGSTAPAVTVTPPGGGGGGPSLGIPGLGGGALAPGGGGGGGGGGPIKFPPLSSFGSAQDMIRAMIRMANRIDAKRYPYRWGGGHNASFSGPYDCSGAVSAVLRAAGLVDRPMVSGEYMRWGAPGKGAVTIYANAGHVYMSILGRFFGTTGMNPGGGAGWFPGAPRAGFAVVHVPFSKFKFKGKTKTRVKKLASSRKSSDNKDSVRAVTPLNQAATTPPPNTSGGTAAPSGTSTTTATGPRQASADTVQGTVDPVPNPAPVQQAQPAQPAPAAPANPAPSPSTQVPSAPAPAPAAPPVTGTGGGPSTPNPAPPTQAPAAPKPPAPSTQAPAVPQAPKPPAAEPGPQQPAEQQPAQPNPPASAAPQAGQVGQQVGGAAPSTKPPKPPAGQGQGSAPNSGQ